MTTGRSASVAHGQNGLQLGERKTYFQCPLNEFHPLLRRRRIFAVISGGALWRRQKAQAFVVPQRIRAHAREMGQLSRTHGSLPPRESLNSGTDSRVKSKLILISTQRLPERQRVGLVGRPCRWAGHGSNHCEEGEGQPSANCDN